MRKQIWDVREPFSPSLMKYGTINLNEDVVVPRSSLLNMYLKIEDIGTQT
jgi:hypothetical protein